MDSEKRHPSDECTSPRVVDNVIQPLDNGQAKRKRHTYARRGKTVLASLSLISLLLVAALYGGPLLKRSPSESGVVVGDHGQALERHIIPNLENPEDMASWYILNDRGEVTSVTLKGKTVTRGMTREQVTDLLGKPSLNPGRDRDTSPTYWIGGNYFHFYFDSQSQTVNFIIIDGGY